MSALRGFKVLSIDLRNISRFYVHPNLSFQQTDIMKMPDMPSSFDFIINCSSIEHVGLVGRYGVEESNLDGDLEAMDRMRKWMKPDGIMLLTIPVGIDALFMPLCRIYGSQRLPQLVDGFAIEKEDYWVKDISNRWIPNDRTTALHFNCSVESMDPMQNYYALGCFVLRKQ